MTEEGTLENSLAPLPAEAAPGDSLIAQFYSFPVGIKPLPDYENMQLYVSYGAMFAKDSKKKCHGHSIQGGENIFFGLKG